MSSPTVCAWCGRETAVRGGKVAEHLPPWPKAASYVCPGSGISWVACDDDEESTAELLDPEGSLYVPEPPWDEVA